MGDAGRPRADAPARPVGRRPADQGPPGHPQPPGGPRGADRPGLPGDGHRDPAGGVALRGELRLFPVRVRRVRGPARGAEVIVSPMKSPREAPVSGIRRAAGQSQAAVPLQGPAEPSAVTPVRSPDTEAARPAPPAKPTRITVDLAGDL